MLETVEDAGVFAGYLEDLCYTPKTLKAIAIRSWWRDRRRDMGPLPRDAPRAAQRVVLGRSADRRRGDHRPRLPLHRDHPELRRQGEPAGRRPVSRPTPSSTRSPTRTTPSRSSASSPAPSGQFEVSWTFRGGMDLRDEVAGTNGTIWLNHFLRTGFEMFTAGGGRRVRRREGGDVSRLAVPRRGRGLGARLRRHVQRHVSRSRRPGRRRRRSTTGTS